MRRSMARLPHCPTRHSDVSEFWLPPKHRSISGRQALSTLVVGRCSSSVLERVLPPQANTRTNRNVPCFWELGCWPSYAYYRRGAVSDEKPTSERWR